MPSYENNNADVPLIENEVTVGNIKPSFATFKGYSCEDIFKWVDDGRHVCVCASVIYIKVIVLHYRDIEHRNLLSETSEFWW